MNTRTLETNVGIINLSEREVLTDWIEMYFTINSLSEEWQEKIYEGIEKAKAEWDEKFLVKRGWCDAGVNILYKNLAITMKGKDISYRVAVDFEDKENARLEDDVVIEVDLSEYEAELLPEIKNAVLEKFF